MSGDNEQDGMVTYQIGDMAWFKPDDPYFTTEDEARQKIAEMDAAKPDEQNVYGLWRHEPNVLPDCIALYFEGVWYEKAPASGDSADEQGGVR